MGNSTAGLVSTLGKSNDDAVKEVAADKLCAKVKQFAQHESYMKAVVKNAGKPLIGMLENGTPKGKNAAAATISYLALNRECKAELAEFGAIPALVKLSKEGAPELQGAAAAALANMVSRSPDNQAALADAGAIPPLVNIVKKGLKEARGWAASALGNMALQHKTNQLRVREAGAIQALVELTAPSASPSAPQKSAPSSGFDLIGTLTCRKRAQPTKPTSKNMEMAARALSSLAFDCEENQEHIIKAGGIDALITLAKEGTSRDEVEAFRALSLVWGQDPTGKIKEKVVAAGAEKVFLEMVRSACDESKTFAAGLLARLAHEDSGIKASVATSGGIRALVELGQTGAPQAKLNAVKALKELSTDCPENEQLICDSGGATLLETFRSGMKFRELRAGEEEALNDAQARVAALKKKGKVGSDAEAEEEADEEDRDPETDPKHDPNKPLCFK